MIPPAGTAEPREAHRLDERRLSEHLRGPLGLTGELVLRQFRGGQSNPTYWIADGRGAWVLRKKPPGKLLPSAHAVEREYRVLAALRDTEVPVPRVLHLCEDADVAGTPFYVMEHVVGRTFWDTRLPGLGRDERTAVFDELARVMAALHRVDPAAVGLGDFGRSDGYLARQVSRWTRQYRASETSRVPQMETLIEWLPGHLPGDEATAIVHGDFRLDNLIYDDETPRAIALIDWELSTLGHPLADLAYHCMLYQVSLPGIGGLVDVDHAVTGIPDERAFIARYGSLVGRAPGIDDWEVYKAVSLFRLAAIAQGVFKRSLQGNASSGDARRFEGAAALLSSAATRMLGI